MIGQSIAGRYERIKPYIKDSKIGDNNINEFEWLSGIVLKSSPDINRTKILEKCHEYGDVELASSVKTALNDRTIKASLFRKFEELLLLVEETVLKDETVKKTEDTGILRESHHQKSLWFYNGIRISSLPQLYSRLHEIDDNIFKEHVNEYKHDIAVWVRDNLHDEKLAARLEKGRNRKQIENIIEHAIHEKIHNTINESDNIHEDKGKSVNPDKIPEDIKILDALELPELPDDIGHILGLKADKVKDDANQKKDDSGQKEAAKEKDKEEGNDDTKRTLVQEDKKIPSEKQHDYAVIPVEQDKEKGEDDDFKRFMGLFEEQYGSAKEDALTSSSLKGEEAYVPKAHTNATRLFVSSDDVEESDSQKRYHAVQQKLAEKEKKLHLLEKEISQGSMPVHDDPEIEFEMQEKISVKNNEIIRLKEEIRSIRNTLKEMHSTPREYEKRIKDNDAHSIMREDMLKKVHNAVLSERIVEDKSARMHPPIPAINEKKAVKPNVKEAKEERETPPQKDNVNAEHISKTPIENDSSNKIERARTLTKVHGDEVFFCKNNRTIRSVIELYNLLSTIDKESFEHHVNKTKNDFSAWINHSVGLPELGSKVYKSKTRNGMKRILQKWIVDVGLANSIGLDDSKPVKKGGLGKKDSSNKTALKEEPKTIAKETLKSDETTTSKEKPKIIPKKPEDFLETIHEHISHDEYDEALSLIGTLRRSLKAKNKSGRSIHDKMNDYELKALESDVKILKLKHH
ncbi:MAG: hypothetical protein ACMXYL_02620 [Candidatus Woesearchaeota archaeon]